MSVLVVMIFTPFSLRGRAHRGLPVGGYKRGHIGNREHPEGAGTKRNDSRNAVFWSKAAARNDQRAGGKTADWLLRRLPPPGYKPKQVEKGEDLSPKGEGQSNRRTSQGEGRQGKAYP